MMWLLPIFSLLLRLNNLRMAIPFADMDWYFASAKLALLTGRLPMLGIPASINWLHQGPLWTYLLLLPMALRIPPVVFTLISGVFAVVLVYVSLGKWPAIILAVWPLAISQSQLPYHTSLIPLLFFISYACIIRKKSYLSGLFIGFLYQSHLLTLIYWPLWVYFIYKNKLSFRRFVLGFILGILPFIIAGPIQTFGIFIWLFKQLITGFSGVSGGMSTAYQVVLLPGLLLVIKWVYAYGNSFSPRRKFEH